MTNKPVYRNVCVYAPMDEAYEVRRKRKFVGTQKVKKVKGILNPEKVEVEEPVYEYVDEHVPTGQFSDVDIDHDAFGNEIESACNYLHEEGYEVVSITPVLRGVHRHEFRTGEITKGNGPVGYGFGYGYSLTSAFMILAKLREDYEPDDDEFFEDEDEDEDRDDVSAEDDDAEYEYVEVEEEDGAESDEDDDEEEYEYVEIDEDEDDEDAEYEYVEVEVEIEEGAETEKPDGAEDAPPAPQTPKKQQAPEEDKDDSKN